MKCQAQNLDVKLKISMSSSKSRCQAQNLDVKLKISMSSSKSRCQAQNVKLKSQAQNVELNLRARTPAGQPRDGQGNGLQVVGAAWLSDFGLASAGMGWILPGSVLTVSLQQTRSRYALGGGCRSTGRCPAQLPGS